MKSSFFSALFFAIVFTLIAVTVHFHLKTIDKDCFFIGYSVAPSSSDLKVYIECPDGIHVVSKLPKF